MSRVWVEEQDVLGNASRRHLMSLPIQRRPRGFAGVTEVTSPMSVLAECGTWLRVIGLVHSRVARPCGRCVVIEARIARRYLGAFA